MICFSYTPPCNDRSRTVFHMPMLTQVWWQITMAYMDLDNLWYKTPEIQLTLPSVTCRLSTVKTGQKMTSLLLHMTRCKHLLSQIQSNQKTQSEISVMYVSVRLLLIQLKGRLTLLRTGFVDRTSYIDAREMLCGNYNFVIFNKMLHEQLVTNYIRYFKSNSTL